MPLDNMLPDLLANKDQVAGGMLIEPTQLFFGIFASIVGIAYIAYGRKKNFYFLLSGICLLLFSFFTFDNLTSTLICIGLVIAPFVLSQILK